MTRFNLQKHHISAFGIFLYSLVSIGILAVLALWTHHPLLFPSLGPTVFLHFYSPLMPTASPKNTILGHIIGVVSGFIALWLFGLTQADPTILTGIDTAHVGAAAVSLALTSSLMLALRVPHPPAGATTLIIALGIMHKPIDLAVLMGAVILLCILSLGINRLRNIPYPIWSIGRNSAAEH